MKKFKSNERFVVSNNFIDTKKKIEIVFAIFIIIRTLAKEMKNVRKYIKIKKVLLQYFEFIMGEELSSELNTLKLNEISKILNKKYNPELVKIITKTITKRPSYSIQKPDIELTDFEDIGNYKNTTIDSLIKISKVVSDKTEFRRRIVTSGIGNLFRFMPEDYEILRKEIGDEENE
jgi:hypothetical protein